VVFSCLSSAVKLQLIYNTACQFVVRCLATFNIVHVIAMAFVIAINAIVIVTIIIIICPIAIA